MPIIGAIVCNAHLPEPTIEFEVVHQISGEWYTNSDVQVWPFAFEQIEFAPSIPEGWIEHLHKEAAKYASAKPAPRLEANSLLAQLGLPTTTHNSMTGKLTRRI